MVELTRLIAFLLRFLYFALCAGGLVLILCKDKNVSRVRILVFGAIATLFTSEALVSLNLMHAICFAVVFAVLFAGTLVYGKLTKSDTHVFLTISLLASMGVAVGAHVMGKGFGNHVLFMVAGVAVCLLTLMYCKAHVRKLAVRYRLLLVVAVVLCAIPLVPVVGMEINGAKSWVKLGPLPPLQPSEFAKVLLTIGLAGYCAANAARLRAGSFRGLFPLLCALGGALGFELLTKDMGTAMIMFAATAAVVTAVSGRRSVLYAAVTLVAIAVILYVGYTYLPHVQTRFDSMIAPELHTGEYEAGTHLLCVESTIANGGLVGTGLGLGYYMWSMPAIETDSIYAVITEELGLVGAALLVLAFITLVVQLVRIIRDLPKGSFESNVLVEVLALFAFQAFVIMAGLVRLIPLTGVTLPFVSRGGSSMISCFALVGICGIGITSQKVEERGYSFSTAYLPALLSAGLVACFCFTVLRADGLRICGYTNHTSTGEITTSDGTLFAHTITEDGKERREYPQHESCVHILSKEEVSNYKRLVDSGIEYCITSSEYKERTSNPVKNLLGFPETLGTTVLTIDYNIQQVAEDVLKGTRAGSVVVLNNEDGSILAEASWPSYDIEELSSLELKAKAELNAGLVVNGDGWEGSYAKQLSDLRGDLVTSADSCLKNRVRESVYPPGSTFKIITSAAALEGDYANPNSTLPGNELKLDDGSSVPNFNNENYGDISLTEALMRSSNSAFASLALKMGNEPLQREAESFGFNAPIDHQLLPTHTSTYTVATTDQSLAWAGVGQPTSVDGQEQGPRATVLQMARVMAAVANGGTLVNPHLVKEGDLSKDEAVDGDALRNVSMSETTLAELRGMLQSSANIDSQGLEVLGKTGTAETTSGNICWYVCSAEGVTVAICIEGSNDDMASDIARPRGWEVLKAAIGLDGQSVDE